MKLLLLFLFITAGSVHTYSSQSGTVMTVHPPHSHDAGQVILWDDITTPLR